MDNIHFICLIQIQNTEIYTAYCKSAKRYRDMNFCSYRPALLLTQSCQQREHAAFRNVIFHRLAIMMVLLVCFLGYISWCFITENACIFSAVVPNREPENDWKSGPRSLISNLLQRSLSSQQATTWFKAIMEKHEPLHSPDVGYSLRQSAGRDQIYSISTFPSPDCWVFPCVGVAKWCMVILHVW